jgi:hypothetical protein
VHAQWEPGMACGNTAGEATRAEAVLRRAGVLADGDMALVRVPGKMSGLSTTAMERGGPAARAVAAASLARGRVELLGGAVTVRIVKPPSLLATMSGTDGGEVRYKPAVLEVSGEGFQTLRLDTAGDNIELRLDEDGDPVTDQNGLDKRKKTTDSGSKLDAAADDASDESAGGSGAGQPSDRGAGASGASNDIVRKLGGPGRNADKNRSGEGSGKSGGGLFEKLPELGALGTAKPLPLPTLPGVPPLTGPDTEAAPAAGPGTTVKISLGDVRQAVSGHAIAAKATAMSVAITKGPDRQAYANSAGSNGVVLDLGLGLLEVAAVAPEPTGGVSDAVGGAAGGLPITGPRVDVLALSGVALLIAGAAALILGMRGRSRP